MRFRDGVPHKTGETAPAALTAEGGDPKKGKTPSVEREDSESKFIEIGYPPHPPCVEMYYAVEDGRAIKLEGGIEYRLKAGGIVGGIRNVKGFWEAGLHDPHTGVMANFREGFPTYREAELAMCGGIVAFFTQLKETGHRALATLDLPIRIVESRGAR
jgi:hypothetical protein